MPHLSAGSAGSLQLDAEREVVEHVAFVDMALGILKGGVDTDPLDVTYRLKEGVQAVFLLGEVDDIDKVTWAMYENLQAQYLLVRIGSLM